MANFRDEEWWLDRTTRIGELENHERGPVVYLHGRFLDSRVLPNGVGVPPEWEYACVSWFYQVPTCRWILRDGKMYDSDGTMPYNPGRRV